LHRVGFYSVSISVGFHMDTSWRPWNQHEGSPDHPSEGCQLWSR